MTDIPDDIMRAARKVVIEDLGMDSPGFLQASYIDCIAEAILAERERSRQLLSEAQKREREARAKALEEAALRVEAKADSYQAEARDVRGSDRDRRFYASVANRLRGAASAIRALQSEER